MLVADILFERTESIIATGESYGQLDYTSFDRTVMRKSHAIRACV